MASNIKIKRSETGGNPAVLGAGELAYSSLIDNGSNGGDRLYIGTGTETDGNAVNHAVIGGKYFTDVINAAAAINTASTLVKRDSSGNFAANAITAALIGNADTATKWATARNLSLTGDATATLSSVDGSAAVSTALTLATVNANVGSFGSTTSIPVVTVNAKGLVTAVSTQSISTALNIAGGTGTDIVSLGVDTLTFAGGTGVATTVSDNQVSFAIGQAVGTTDAVTFSSVTAALVGNADTATKWATARNLSLTGDATATLSSVDGSAAVSTALTLATVNANIGSFGSTTAIPVITVNAKGLITAVSTQSISTALSITAGTGTDTVNLGVDTLTFEGGTGITTAVTDNKVTFSLGQAVDTTSSVTFNNLTVNGVFTSNDITSSSITVDGNATITGNLTVQGTTTTVNSTAVAITDINLTLAKDAADASQANGAGITIAGPAVPPTLTYTSANDRWNLNKDLTVANVFGNLTGAVTGNADTATKWATARDLSLTGDATATLSSVDGSAAVSTALTLATVNSNVGSYGTSTTIPAVTVNAKGLVTAITTSAIPTATTTILGLASFDSASFGVSAGAVTLNKVDGGTY